MPKSLIDLRAEIDTLTMDNFATDPNHYFLSLSHNSENNIDYKETDHLPEGYGFEPVGGMTQ